jgi:hypothetical protein
MGCSLRTNSASLFCCSALADLLVQLQPQRPGRQTVYGCWWPTGRAEKNGFAARSQTDFWADNTLCPHLLRYRFASRCWTKPTTTTCCGPATSTLCAARTRWCGPMGRPWVWQVTLGRRRTPQQRPCCQLDAPDTRAGFPLGVERGVGGPLPAIDWRCLAGLCQPPAFSNKPT